MPEPYIIEVDLKNKKYSQETLVTQFDDDVTFIVRITDDGQPIVLSGTFKLVCKRTDNQSFFTPGTKTADNEITFDLGTSEVEVAGKVQAAIQIFDAEDNRVSSIPFNYTVLSDLSIGQAPTSTERSLLRMIIDDGPGIIGEAQQVAEENKTRFLDAVDTVATRDATYPTPLHGDTVRVTSEAKTYRFVSGTGWVVTDVYNPTAVDNLASKMGTTSQLVTTDKTDLVRSINSTQVHKLTADNGNRTYLTDAVVDLLTLAPGFYETTGNRLSHAPWSDAGLVEVDVFGGSSSRKQIILNYSYSKRMFFGIFHTDAEFKGWEEFSKNTNISAFLETLMNNMYEKVAAIQTEKTKSIGFITDTHYIRNGVGVYGDVGLQHIRNIADFSRYGLLDLLIHGGDLINGKEAPSTYKRELYDVFKAINSASCPKMVCKGNHDYGIWYNANTENPILSNVLSPIEWYKRFTKPFQKDFVVDSANPTGSYFYKDYDDVKLRVIVLNTADNAYLDTYKTDIDHHAMSGAQLSWLANTALNFTGKTDATNWNVITVSHVTPIGPDNLSKVVNSSVFSGIINAFKNGTTYTGSGAGDYAYNISVDFTGRAGRHIAHIGGHYHIDQNYVSTNIRFITTLLSAPADNTTGLTSDTRPRERWKETEDSWCVFTVDTTNRKLYLSRFGQGDDNLVIDY